MKNNINIVSGFLAASRKHLRLVAMLAGGLFAIQVQTVQALTVTTSIPPLAGIVAPLLGENDKINVVLKAGHSPHSFQMTPKNMRQIAESDLILWVKTPVDVWMKKPLHNSNAEKIGMSDLTGLKRLPVRKGGLWEKHDHHHGEEGHHDEHHDDHHSGSHQSGNHEKHNNAHHDDHHDEHYADQKMDGHLWLSYENAILLVKEASKKLQMLKPKEANLIKSREAAWLQKLANLDQKINKQLLPLAQANYLVLHDAYQYFEDRYNLQATGSITLNPTISPSLKRVGELREKIENGNIKCVFKEPQFPEKRVYAVVRGMQVNIGSLDPIGVVKDKQAKNQLYLPYDQFLQQLSNGYLDCLSK